MDESDSYRNEVEAKTSYKIEIYLNGFTHS